MVHAGYTMAHMDLDPGKLPTPEEEARLNQAIGAEVRALRSKRRMSLDDLARESGVGKRTLGRLELGERSFSMPQLFAVCRVLGTRPSLIVRAAGIEAGIEEE